MPASAQAQRADARRRQETSENAANGESNRKHRKSQCSAHKWTARVAPRETRFSPRNVTWRRVARAMVHDAVSAATFALDKAMQARSADAQRHTDQQQMLRVLAAARFDHREEMGATWLRNMVPSWHATSLALAEAASIASVNGRAVDVSIGTLWERLNNEAEVNGSSTCSAKHPTLKYAFTNQWKRR